jgi:hypothetical protein
MTDWVRRALTRKRTRKGPRGSAVVEEANEKLVYTVKFALGMTACLSAVEISNIIFLKSWNSEIFSAITTLIGLVTGILIGQQA